MKAFGINVLVSGGLWIFVSESGANFLVEWFAAQPVTAPIIEAVMIFSTSSREVSAVMLERLRSRPRKSGGIFVSLS